ncbi:MAG: c-type cytochrome biogenesis protein CcmI, partial [Cytophaga sp.]|nr:c-type cytochrome biogenesis protein CcmI [Undibacterium sp.]
MSVFFIVAALLTAGALMFVLPPLLRKDIDLSQHVLRDEINLAVLRDQMRELDADLAASTINPDAYQSAKLELERRVAEDVQAAAAIESIQSDKPWTAVVVGAGVPILAIALYFLLGSPGVFDPTKAAGTQGSANQVTEEQIIAMVAGLEQSLKSKPDDAQGWNMLARSYHTMGKYREAAVAYANVVRLIPDNADLLADYADALAMAQNRSLLGQPEKIIAQALIVDPKNVKALALAGSAAFDKRDFQTAVTQWKKILLLVPPDSETARSTMSSIAEAQRLAGEPGTIPTPATVAPNAPSTAAQTTAAQTTATQTTATQTTATQTTATQTTDMVKVEGSVEIDAAVRAKVADTDAVFIFARAAEGPKFPL